MQAKIIRNLFVIPIFINDDGPYNFVLDTGSGLTLITDSVLRTKLQLIHGTNVKVYGAGNNVPIDALLTDRLSLRIGKILSGKITVAILSQDPFFLSSYLGIEIDGIIGYDLYSSFVVRQNSQSGQVTFYRPGRFHFTGKGDSVDISIRNLKPFVQSTLLLENDSTKHVELMIDTGASFPFSLDSTGSGGIPVPPKHLRVQIGVGLSGNVFGEVARIPSISLGKTVYQDALCVFPDRIDSISIRLDPGKSGSIGSELLKRYLTTFDYADKKIYLKPTLELMESFRYNMSGMSLATGGEYSNAFVISSVEENSPASEAGLLPNDVILEVNLTKTSEMTLDQVDGILREYEGGTLLLKVLRNKDFFYTVLHLRKLI